MRAKGDESPRQLMMQRNPGRASTSLRLLLIPLALAAAACSANDPVDEPATATLPSNTVRVVTQNLGDVITPRPTVDQIMTVFRQMPVAHVYLVQETHGSRTAAALAAALSTPQATYHHAYSGRAGLAVISSLPIVASRAAQDASALEAIVEAPSGRRLRVVSIHLPAFNKPRQGDGDARIGPIYGALRLAREAVTPNGRSRAAETILSWLEEAESPPATIIGGDLNTVPLTLAPRKVAKHYRDSLRGSGDFFKGTYRRIAGPISARVDFLFHDPTLEVLHAFVHPGSAGDHLPVYAEYAFR